MGCWSSPEQKEDCKQEPLAVEIGRVGSKLVNMSNVTFSWHFPVECVDHLKLRKQYAVPKGYLRFVVRHDQFNSPSIKVAHISCPQ